MFEVYILQSVATGRYYVGSTGDLARRLAEHQVGETLATRGRGPWQLVHREAFATRAEAVRRERAIKAKKSAASIRRLLCDRAG